MPGHTMASIALRIGDAAFVNDTLFMPDSGTARADFPGGCARQLHASIERILALPDETRVFVGHDYGQGGREVRWESTVAEQKVTNTHFASRPTVERFVRAQGRRATRRCRCRASSSHALQVNLAAGRAASARRAWPANPPLSFERAEGNAVDVTAVGRQPAWQVTMNRFGWSEIPCLPFTAQFSGQRPLCDQRPFEGAFLRRTSCGPSCLPPLPARSSRRPPSPPAPCPPRPPAELPRRRP